VERGILGRGAGRVTDLLLDFFFFQAEDGIRDKLVTGVQTCALPIWRLPPGRQPGVQAAGTPRVRSAGRRPTSSRLSARRGTGFRSEERRVGKEGRSGWSVLYEKKKRDGLSGMVVAVAWDAAGKRR